MQCSGKDFWNNLNKRVVKRVGEMKNSSTVRNNKNKIRGTNPARYFSNRVCKYRRRKERADLPIGRSIAKQSEACRRQPGISSHFTFASNSRGRNRFTLSARYDMPAREIQPIRWHDKSIDNYVRDAHRCSFGSSPFAQRFPRHDTRCTRRVNRVTIPFPPDTNYQRLIQIRSLYTFD